MKTLRALSSVAIALLFSGCQGAPPPLAVVPHVELQRFMGPWYVIASIPTFIETDAYNAIESYQLDTDGTIATTFTFREGGFDGAPKRYTPRGYVTDSSSNAVWGMQFIWPIKAEYRITYLADDYSQTVISRSALDYVWIMARTPAIADADYQRLVQLIAAQGYDINRLRKVPQQWN